MKTVWKYVKWLLIALAVALIVGAGYVYFIYLAKPARINDMAEVKDPQWRTVDLGGRSLCSDGSPYFIFVRKGASDNLIIHFSGGGACWDDTTCSAPITLLGALTQGDAKDLKAFYYPKTLDFFDRFLNGVFDRQAPKNPFKDWSVVFIPYCTGDFHVGDKTTRYNVGGTETEVHHNGRDNTLNALAWVFDNFRSPKKILVSGESAGGFASAYWAPYVANQYKGDERIYQLSDCSQLTSARWPAILNSVWNSKPEALLGFRVENDAYADALLNRTDSLRKPIRHLNSNTLYDGVLPRFSAVLHHQSTDNKAYIYDWSKGMRTSVKKLAAANIDYQFFLTDCRYDPQKVSTPHTLMGSDISLYACKSDGLTYMDWLRKNVIDDTPVSVGGALLDKPNPN
ncbi:pectin acetylesterase-family hydrolase [Fibrella aestuarina]|nr:pectin acetylesterase-family hydrolase [Fibrella aestuarina]